MIVSLARLRMSYTLALAAGRDHEAAVAHVAQSFALDETTVREAVQREEAQA